jgi:septum formation protein
MRACVPVHRIVLASASPRRLELLRSLGLDVDVVLSNYDEPELPGVAPIEVARRHAREKLERTAFPEKSGRIVVAADTVVDVDGDALGKPRDAREAAAMLRRLSGRTHRVHTAFALSIPDRAIVEEVATTSVTFYALEAEEIDDYVATGEPLDKAGAYGIQGRAAALVEGIDGDFYTVMGFPLARFVRALRRSGFTLPGSNKAR